MQLNKLYLEICKSSMITPAGITEFTNMCTVLNDQVLTHSYKENSTTCRRSYELEEFSCCVGLHNNHIWIVTGDCKTKSGSER